MSLAEATRARRWRHPASGWLGVALWALLIPAAGLRAQEQIPEVARELLEEADRQREAGNSEEALARYREVLERAPGVVAAFVGVGALEHAAGRTEEALAAFTAGLEHAPADRTLLFNASAVALQLGRLDDALRHAEHGVREHPKDAAFESLRGRILVRLERLDEAREAMEAALRLDDSDARAHFALGNLYHRLGRKEDAIASFRKAIDADDDLIAAHYNLGAVLFEMERRDEARTSYERALAPLQKQLDAGQPVDAVHARAFLNLGAIYVHRADWAKALQAYSRAQTLEPESAVAVYNIGFIHYQQGRWDEAYASYERAATLDPDLPLSYLHRGLIDVRRGRLEQAAALLDRGLPQLQGDDRREALLALGRAEESLGRADDARQRYLAALDDSPGELEALLGMGRLLRRSGELAEAAAYLERARAQAPSSSRVALQQAALARASGDPAAEKALYAQVLAKAGDRPELWPVRLQLALLTARDGGRDEALRELKALVDRLDRLGDGGPDPAERALVLSSYGMLLASVGDAAAARAAFESALREQPEDATAKGGLAVLLARAGDIDGATQALTRLAASVPDALRPLVSLDLGLALHLAGRPAEARAHLEAAARAFPGDAGVQLALGEIDLAAGDHTRALEHLTAAHAACAGTPVASAERVQVAVGPPTPDARCDRAGGALALALVASAGEHLEAAGRGSTPPGAALMAARDQAQRALSLPLVPSNRAVALFLRGSARLMLRDGAGRADLEQALAAGLPPMLVSLARNNLGVALYREGAVAEARAHFEAARAAQRGPASATLNLAIAYHEEAASRQKALPLYDEYLARGGVRVEEVRQWADGLRKVYQ